MDGAETSWTGGTSGRSNPKGSCGVTRKTTEPPSRVPLTNGDEHDALTKSKRYHTWRAGDRARIKRTYWRRLRSVVKAAIRGMGHSECRLNETRTMTEVP